VVKAYNKIARALVQFEITWHSGWTEAVVAAKVGTHNTIAVCLIKVQAGLMATVLVRHPEQPSKVYVNFDAEIMQVIRETKEMIRLRLPVPDITRSLCTQEDALKVQTHLKIGMNVTSFLQLSRDRLQLMLQDAELIANRVPLMYKRLLVPHMEDLIQTISLV